MTTLYKLTTQDYLTRAGENNETDWTQFQPIKPYTNNPEMCSKDVYHAYVDFDLAFLLNPIHGNIDNPRILECDGKIVVCDWGKAGVFELEVIREINVPEWVGSDYEWKVGVWFAVLCAESVLGVWNDYNGEDNRVKNAINAAKEYLNNPSQDAADAAARAADAARAAARAADAGYAAYAAADAAARAADAGYAAYAAYAAGDAAYAAEEIDFVKIAKQAVVLGNK